jgi:hypothetical protein
MRNVWCLPSTDTIHTWLKKVGFKNIEWIGLMLTTILGVATTLALTKKKIKTMRNMMILF